MLCLYCDKPLGLLKRAGDGAFCTEAHRMLYEQDLARLAIGRLHEMEKPRQDRYLDTVIEPDPAPLLPMPWQFEPRGARKFRFRRYPFVRPEPAPSSSFSQTPLRPVPGWMRAVLRDLTPGTNDAKDMVLEGFLAHAVLEEPSEFHREVRKPPKGFTPSLPI